MPLERTAAAQRRASADAVQRSIAPLCARRRRSPRRRPLGAGAADRRPGRARRARAPAAITRRAHRAHRRRDRVDRRARGAATSALSAASPPASPAGSTSRQAERRPASASRVDHARRPSHIGDAGLAAHRDLVEAAGAVHDAARAARRAHRARAPPARTTRRSNTPTTWCATLAGLVSGPSRLKIVRVPSSRRGPAACRVAAWNARREREADAGLGDAALDHRRLGVDRDAERLEHVGRAATATTARGCRAWRPRAAAAATTIAASVETLTVPAPSPPVPQVSIAARRIRAARAAAPARASRAPRRRSRRRSRPSCAARPGGRRSAPASPAPSMIVAERPRRSRRATRSSPAERARRSPRATSSPARSGAAPCARKFAQQRLAGGRHDRLGVELHALERRAVPA